MHNQTYQPEKITVPRTKHSVSELRKRCPLLPYDSHVHGLIHVDVQVVRHLLRNGNQAAPEQGLAMLGAPNPETGMKLITPLLQREDWTDLSVRIST